MQTDTMISIGIGLIITIYFYRKSLRNKNPIWAVKSINLIDGFTQKYEGLQIKFKKKNAETLTISKVVFWNKGKETINKSDIETIDHLQIITKNNAIILDTKVLAQNNASSQFAINLEGNGRCAYLDFDYLDEKQGAVFQVIHTGKSSEDLQVTGSIKGAKSIEQIGQAPKWIIFLKRIKINERISRNITGGLGITLGLLSAFFSFLELLLIIFQQPLKPQIPTYTQMLINLSLGVILFYEGWLILKISNIAPKGLEVFDND